MYLTVGLCFNIIYWSVHNCQTWRTLKCNQSHETMWLSKYTNNYIVQHGCGETSTQLTWLFGDGSRRGSSRHCWRYLGTWNQVALDSSHVYTIITECANDKNPLTLYSVDKCLLYKVTWLMIAAFHCTSNAMQCYADWWCGYCHESNICKAPLSKRTPGPNTSYQRLVAVIGPFSTELLKNCLSLCRFLCDFPQAATFSS